MTTIDTLKAARRAFERAGARGNEARNAALNYMADSLITCERDILAANAEDVQNAANTISSVMIDRLTLTPARVRDMAQGIREVAALDDPVGRSLKRYERPNGLIIEKVSVPLGVIAIIFESRPNVASDAVALSIKCGSACVLRGGKEAFRSVRAIVCALRAGLKRAGFSEDMVCQAEDASRQSALELMGARGLIDLLIPRGGAGLIRACVENAKVPCIETGTGICHIYVDKYADIKKALDIVDNAKTSRPSVCNACEVCLVNADIAPEFLPLIKARLVDARAQMNPVELRLDLRAAEIINGTPAGDADFDTEFLDYILAIKVVDGVDEAIEHIQAHSTHHSDAIVSEDADACARFTSGVDSAAVYVNASTRFTDGGVFGLGCEMGISTQKLHARGPMGLEELVSYKYVVTGTGHIR